MNYLESDEMTLGKALIYTIAVFTLLSIVSYLLFA